MLLLLVAAGSATAGIVAGRDTGTGGSATIVATSPVVPAPPSPPAAEPQPTPTPPARPTQALPPAEQLTEWPARDGYTVVLTSIPARGTGLDDARSKVKAARSSGVRDVGIIVSSRFSSLHPGYYVVFAGVFDSLDDAQTATNRLSGRYPNAYARQITR